MTPATLLVSIPSTAVVNLMDMTLRNTCKPTQPTPPKFVVLLRKSALVLLGGAMLWINGCQAPPPPRAETGPGNPETPAGKAGKLAYKVEKETEKVAKEANQKIKQAARDAHAGYTDAEKKPDK